MVLNIKVRVLGQIAFLMVVSGCSLLSSHQSSLPNLSSGGLGLTQKEWEQLHGKAGSADSGYVYYENRNLIFNFMEGPAGYIKRHYMAPNYIDIDTARNDSKKLIPSDSKLIRTYNLDSKYVVDLYFSEMLKHRFTEDYWTGGAPGNFTVSFNATNDKVKDFIIGLGNNP